MLPPAAVAEGIVELRHRLVDVEGPGECGLGRHRLVAEAGEPAQEHVDLHLRALGRRPAGTRRAAGPSSRASTAGPTPLSTSLPRSVSRGPTDDLAVRADRRHLGAGAQLGARLAGRAFEFAR